MRKEPLVEGEYYHVYNRGVDKRLIFSNEKDVERFLQSMMEFNTKEPIGSIYENSFRKINKKTNQLGHRMSKLVEIVAYCIKNVRCLDNINLEKITLAPFNGKDF